MKLAKPWAGPECKFSGDEPLFRRPATGQGVLVALNCDLHTEIPTPTIVRIAFGQPGTIHDATKDDWSAAKPLPFVEFRHTAPELVGPEPGPTGKNIVDPRPISFRGHLYQKAGEVHFGYAPSGKEGHYLLITSFNGGSYDGKADYSNSYFIEVFDTRSTKRVAYIKGRWNAFTPEGVLHGIQWISDTDNLIFLNGSEDVQDRRDIFFCHFE